MNYSTGGYRYDADRFGESLTYYSGRWDVKDYITPRYPGLAWYQ
jgi:hypothetical protein